MFSTPRNSGCTKTCFSPRRNCCGKREWVRGYGVFTNRPKRRWSAWVNASRPIRRSWRNWSSYSRHRIHSNCLARLIGNWNTFSSWPTRNGVLESGPHGKGEIRSRPEGRPRLGSLFIGQPDAKCFCGKFRFPQRKKKGAKKKERGGLWKLPLEWKNKKQFFHSSLQNPSGFAQFQQARRRSTLRLLFK